MSQENERPNSAMPEGLLPVKRKRGRPRKEDIQFQGGNPALSLGSDGAKRIRRRKIEPAYPPAADNALVGQIVNGVLDGSFDAGYLLTVRVGHTDTVLRGVVFEPGLFVPISPENDVAPQVKMCQRNETPLHVTDLPNMTPSSPQVLQCESKGQQTVELQPRNGTDKGSSNIKTNLMAENLQRKDTAVPIKGSVSPSTLQVMTNTEQKPDILSRNENTHMQEGPSEDISKVPTELLQSKKSVTSLLVDVTKVTHVASESTNSEMVEILQENEITPVTKGPPNEANQESLVELQAQRSVLNAEQPAKFLQENHASLPIEGSVNDINQTPLAEAQFLKPEVKNDQPEEILQREAISVATHDPQHGLVKEHMVISQKPLEPQLLKPTSTEKNVSLVPETKLGPCEDIVEKQIEPPK